MLGMGIALGLFLIVVIVGVTVLGSIWLLTTFWSASIVFSRIAFSLLMAFPLKSRWDLVDGKMNYWLCALIVLAIISALSLLPRVNVAIKFFCTLLIAVLVTETVAVVVCDVIEMFTKSEFVMTMLYEIILKVVCTVLAIGAMIEEFEMTEAGQFSNTILVLVEKILAALIYGASAACLLSPTNGNWEVSGWVYLVVLVITSIVAFFADRVLIGVE